MTIRSPRGVGKTRFRLDWDSIFGSRERGERPSFRSVDRRRSVVLFRAHEDNEINRRTLAALRSGLPEQEVVVVSYLKEKPRKLEGIFKGAHILTAADAMKMPYERKLRRFDPNDVRGYCELPVMSFFREHPSFDFYWIIEFDVRYTGGWHEIFESLSSSDADLLGTTISTQADYPDWPLWETLRMNDGPLRAEYCVKSFMPFGRVSRAALQAIDELYVRGLSGHPEATWPAACLMSGLTIADIGGDGAYTLPQWRGKHYVNTPLSTHISPGTFVWRPPHRQTDVDASDRTSMLWHPVKS